MKAIFCPAYMSAGIMVLSMNILILRIGAASFFKTTFWKIDRLFLFRSWVEEKPDGYYDYHSFKERFLKKI